MTLSITPAEKYNDYINNYKFCCDNEKKKLNRISWLRLAAFLILCLSVYSFIKTSSQMFTIFLSFITFIYLIILYGRIKKKIAYYSRLVEINVQSLKRGNDEWHSFPDDGSEFINFEHRFAHDLDIAGKGSVFQWINTTNTPLGRLRLKETLFEPEKDVEIIQKRQKAVIELSSKIEWRQKIQAMGFVKGKKFNEPSEFLEWIEDDVKIIRSKVFHSTIRVLPIITISLFIIPFIISSLPKSLFLISLCVQLIVILIYNKSIRRIFKLTDKYKEDIKSYFNIIKTIEEEKCDSEYLNDLVKPFFQLKKNASEMIKKLDIISDYMNLRFSSFHFIINMISLWDFHCLLAIENWKDSAGKKIKQWLEIVAEIESVSSLAIILHDNPEWAMPEFFEDRNKLIAENAGHPLISKVERVNNDIELKGAGNIHIITGSNMSGKSTLLRTTGVNLILAYAGAPVCASFMKCSVMDVFTSMRISDNLEKNISSFYAELVRVRMILEDSEKDNPMLFLLDEIFRGTNSRERKIGAMAVLKLLSKRGTTGMVATHDLELAELSSIDASKFENFFFRENYKDNKIQFDYIMRKGISDTMNAVYLMKMVGIDV